MSATAGSRFAAAIAGALLLSSLPAAAEPEKPRVAEPPVAIEVRALRLKRLIAKKQSAQAAAA